MNQYRILKSAIALFPLLATSAMLSAVQKARADYPVFGYSTAPELRSLVLPQLQGFSLPSRGPLANFAAGKPIALPIEPIAPRLTNISAPQAGIKQAYIHGPAMIRYSVWLFPHHAGATYENATGGGLSVTVPFVDYVGPQSIQLPPTPQRSLDYFLSSQQRREHRKWLIMRRQKSKAPIDAKTLDAVSASWHKPITQTMTCGLRVGRFLIVGIATQDFNAIAVGSAKPSQLLPDKEMKRRFRDVMIALAKRAQSRHEGR